MNRNSLLGLRESLNTGRIDATWALPFTDPVTFGLRARGGAIFEQGIVVGDNDTTITGALRFRNDDLQLRKANGWEDLATIPVTGGDENVIVVFGTDGELEGSSVSIENKNIIGVNDITASGTIDGSIGNFTFVDADTVSGNTGAFNTIDSDFIHGITGQFSSLIPNGGSLEMGSALLRFPNVDGATGEALLTDGNRSLSFDRVPVYNTTLSGISGDRMLGTIDSADKPYEVQVMEFGPTIDRKGITGLGSLSTQLLYTNRIEAELAGTVVTSHSDFNFLTGSVKVTSAGGVPTTVSQTLDDTIRGADFAILTQPFVPTTTGRLSQVTLGVRVILVGVPPIKTPTTSWVIEIYTGANGPEGTLLGKSDVQTVIAPSTTTIVFNNFDQEISLVTGGQYSIYITTSRNTTFSTAYVQVQNGTVVGFQELKELSGGSWVDSGTTSKFSYTLTSQEVPIIFLSSAPTTSGDAGATGAVAWDDNYFYMKTGTGWGRLQWDKAF